MTTVEPCRRSSRGGPGTLSFDVLASDVSPRALVTVQGELDAYGARQLGDCLRGILADGWREIDLDLAGVTLDHFDGLGALQLVLVETARAGGIVRPWPASALVCRLLSEARPIH